MDSNNLAWFTKELGFFFFKCSKKHVRKLVLETIVWKKIVISNHNLQVFKEICQNQNWLSSQLFVKNQYKVMTTFKYECILKMLETKTEY